MSLRIVAGSASRDLAGAIATELGTKPAGCALERFPDGELRPAVDEMRDDDVYVVQATGPPVNDHIIELLLLLDACRRAGAERLTAVVPYLGYARQDRRSHAGQAIATRVVADAIAACRASRLVVVDPHTAAFEAMSTIPVEVLTAVPVLATAVAPIAPANAVVVAPDLGGVKLAEHYASILGRPVAVVRKTRLSGATVRAEDLVGDFDGRPAIIVDDMISTGGTIEAAAHLLAEHGSTTDVTVAATHGLLVADAGERLARLGLRRLLVTDSVAPKGPAALPREVCSIALLFADGISRLHRGDPLEDLLTRA